MNIEAQKDYALTLLEMSSYDHETRHSIEGWLLAESNPRTLSMAIDKLRDNMLDRVTSGMNYNSTHISNHINKLR